MYQIGNYLFATDLLGPTQKDENIRAYPLVQSSV